MTLYTYQSVAKPLDGDQFRGYLQRLPEVLWQSVLRYKNWDDQHTTLLGKVLLQD
ncbi:MAG: hypothetical protein H7Y12_00945, partial [Sphingobacteriaceae bacterium]|nr:hypothetical protein [Cytophagaceae bacterium]